MSFGQYANLDFDQIKTSIKDYLRSNSNFTDYDFEGSNLSVLVDTLAYNTYLTAYNTNLALNETFLDAAVLRENVVSLVRNIGYVPRSRRSAIAKVFFRINGLTCLTATLKAGLSFSGTEDNTTFTFSIPEDITVNVINGVAKFTDIEIYEGTFAKTFFTVNKATFDQKFILPNSFVDTSTLRVILKPSINSQISVEYKQVDNILKVDSSSSVFLVQEVADERYELLFGDGIIGTELVNNNYIEASYIISSGRQGNGAASFSLVGVIYDENDNAISPSKISRVSTSQRASNGDEIESINSIKHYAPRIYSSQYRAVTASDYEAVIGYIYPNVDSVTAYGGEELSPPKYGKVYLSIKPRNGDNISESTKRSLLEKLKNYSVAGIVPEFTDAKYLNVEINSAVYYNTAKNNRPTELRSSIINSLNQYANSLDLNKFGGRFKYSKVQSLIDSVNYAITSNITSVIMRRDLNALIGNNTQYELCFGNKFHTPYDSYNIVSTSFKIINKTEDVYLADRKINSSKGEIFFFTYVSGGTPKIIKNNAGTVNYTTGEILIDTVNITATEVDNDIVQVQSMPESNDVIGLRDLYIKFDVGSSKISLIKDVISSGENTSGSRLTSQTSYATQTYVRTATI